MSNFREAIEFNNVLVGVDGRQGGRDAIALARQLAAPGARLTLANVYGEERPHAPGRGNSHAWQHHASREMLKRAREAAAIDAKILALHGTSVADVLHTSAEHRGGDLLVIGSCHRGSLGRVFLRNHTIESLEGAACPVAIAPAGYATNPLPLARLGVGFDGSRESEDALAAARGIAARSGSEIEALSVISLQSFPYGAPVQPGWSAVVEQLTGHELSRDADLEDVDRQVGYGVPRKELARFGERLDLLVVGSRGYGPVGRLLNGSSSHYLAQHSHCPLLVLPRRAVM